MPFTGLEGAFSNHVVNDNVLGWSHCNCTWVLLPKAGQPGLLVEQYTIFSSMLSPVIRSVSAGCTASVDEAEVARLKANLQIRW